MSMEQMRLNNSVHSRFDNMEIILSKYNELKFIAREHFVETLEVYGSVINSSFSEKSDIDLLVRFKEMPFYIYSKNYFSFLEKLESLFEREIDLCIIEEGENELFFNSLKTNRRIIYENIST